MKKGMKVNPFIGFVMVLLVTTSVTLYGLNVYSKGIAADQQVAHTNSVLAKADQLLLGMVDMETGLRGYMLTGQEDFLEPYRSGKVLFDTSLEDLMNLTKDNSSQVERWKEIKTLADQWEADWAEKDMQIRRDVDTGKTAGEAIFNVDLSRAGKTKMDAIRQKVAEGKVEEVNILKDRVQVEQRANDWAYEGLVGGVILSLITGITYGVFLTLSNIKNKEHIEIQHLLLEEREKERVGIARDLHDGPVQDLIAATMTLQSLLNSGSDPQAVENIDTIRSCIQKVIADLRAYAMELRSPVLNQFGLEKAIQSYLEAYQKKHPEMKISITAQQSGDLLPPTSRDVYYRIFQESMNNITRHSHASEVNVAFHNMDGQAVLEIRDNGIGFEPPTDWLSHARHGHLGLVGIRERADSIGGNVVITSKPGSGTSIKVTAPIK